MAAGRLPYSLQNRRISGASAIHERAREARGQKYPPNDSGSALRARSRASRALSFIALAPLIRLFCRLTAVVEGLRQRNRSMEGKYLY